eukprot:TRINITY_DN3505_c0_g2_i1.p1 TRINITY_DN3505_c0_g2~~TRINITY_DN3505_c0_g2_i1.p1  ORF type:complete len:161 (+),score=4.04 TRINITY_DN3505_c0_g2_i1:583-1065(+)
MQHSISTEIPGNSGFFLTESSMYSPKADYFPSIKHHTHTSSSPNSHLLRSHYAHQKHSTSGGSPANSSILNSKTLGSRSFTLSIFTDAMNSNSIMDTINQNAYLLLQTMNLESPRTKRAMTVLGYSRMTAFSSEFMRASRSILTLSFGQILRAVHQFRGF